MSLTILGLAPESGLVQPGGSVATTPVVAPALLAEHAARAADYSAAKAGRAVLVMQHGQVIFERADNGWSLDKPHPLASGSKSFTGVMAMLAVQDELLTLDELASDTITEWKGDERKAKITVRHLLTLASGLEPSDRAFTTSAMSGAGVLGEGAGRRADRIKNEKTTPEGEANTRGVRPLDNFTTSVTMPMEGEPGATFHYGSVHFYAFGELLQRKLAASKLEQKTVMEYLVERLMKPIGITSPLIGRDQSGNPNLPGGFLLTARDWAAFGRFVLQNGAVKNADGTMTQLLKPELLMECFKPSATNAQYGLTWWLYTSGQASPEFSLIADGGGLMGGDKDADRDDAGAGRGTNRKRLRDRIKERMAEREVPEEILLAPDGKPVYVYMAAGLGKQRLYVLPQYDAVVVRFAEAKPAGAAFEDREFLRLLLGK